MEARILYLDLEPDELSERLGRALSRAGCGQSVEYFPSDKALLERLLVPLDDVMLVIIRARDREHLMKLAIHSMFLRGARVVIVLPEMEHSLVSLAHIFYPCLVLSVEDGLDTVAAAVTKLILPESEGGIRRAGVPALDDDWASRGNHWVGN